MEDIHNSPVLNFVYDDWPIGNPFPFANRPKNFKGIERNKYDTNDEWLPSYVTMKAFPGIHIENHTIDSVMNFPEKKFYYHIWHRNPLYNNFFRKNILPLDNHIIELVKSVENLDIIFMNEAEIECKDSLKKLDELLKFSDIDASRFWVINNDSKLNSWKAELSTKINVHSCRLLAERMKNEPVASFTVEKDPNSFFLCHNRTPRGHRYSLLCLLKKNKILENTNWSLINGWQSDKVNPLAKYSLFVSEDLQSLKEEINYFDNIDFFKSKFEMDSTIFDTRENQHIFNFTKTYENSFVNLVTETNFENKSIHISEKSLKPLYYLQFPLILASYQHNKYLKDVYGFDLFEDIINYDFDNISNNRDRLFAYVDEVRRINNNKQFFIEFYIANKDRFIKNHELLRSFVNTHDFNFFSNMAKI